MKNVGIFVFDTSCTGGTGKVAKNLAEGLSKYYNVHLINLFNQNQEVREENNNYRIYTIKSKRVNITKNLFKLSKKFKKYVIENNIEVLLVIDSGLNTIAILGTKNTGIKTVYCEHLNLEHKTLYGKDINLKNTIYVIINKIRQRLGAKYMDKIVTLTERDRRNFMHKLNVSKNKIIAILDWIEKEENQEEVYNSNSKKIITVGRLAPVKGHDLLIKVAKKVKERHNDWSWEIYGEGTHRKKINKNIQKNNLQDFVILKGNTKTIKKYYKEASIFVLTSYYEGLSLVLLEAQQAKLPTISFDCPIGPAEIIADNKNGYLIPAYDVNIMAEKINELIENEEKRKEFSRNSNINMWKFDKENIIKQWIELIDNI